MLEHPEYAEVVTAGGTLNALEARTAVRCGWSSLRAPIWVYGDAEGDAADEDIPLPRHVTFTRRLRRLHRLVSDHEVR